MKCRALFIGIAAMAAVGCAGSSTSPAAVDDDLGQSSTGDTKTSPDTTAIEVPRATCEDYVGGSVVLSPETAYEAFPGYDDELAALDLLGLPESLDLSSLNGLERSLIAYMLEWELDSLTDRLVRDAVYAVDPMGLAVLGAFAEAKRVGGEGVDLPFLRRGLHRYYQCVREFPLTLADFKKAVYDFDSLTPYDLESFPKNTTRRLRDDHDAHVYIAQTLIDDVVRETEIILGAHRKDGALDFIAYDSEGNLEDRGVFATAAGTNISGASPYTCIACHFEKDPTTFKINVVFPQM